MTKLTFIFVLVLVPFVVCEDYDGTGSDDDSYLTSDAMNDVMTDVDTMATDYDGSTGSTDQTGDTETQESPPEVELSKRVGIDSI